MRQRQSLASFLEAAGKSLKSSVEGQDVVRLVIGNESCDLDSITSAVLYAYLSSLFPAPSLAPIPLLSIPRSDLSLRPELTLLLPHAGLSPSHLPTLDDLPDSDVLPPRRTEWTLVDHNVLPGRLGEVYGARVRGVVDHHVDEGRVPEDAQPRVIRECGSCTSLVVDACRAAWERAVKEDEASTPSDGSDSSVDAQLAKFALASVLVDTDDLRDASKTTRLDVDIVDFLQGLIGQPFDRRAYFESLVEAKRDIASIPLDGVLRKDYKEWREGGIGVGISSAVASLRDLSSKAQAEAGGKGEGMAETERDDVPDGSDDRSALIAAAADFARQRDLAVCAIMTAYTPPDSDGGFARELMLLALTDRGEAAVQKFLEQSGGELRLERDGSEDGDRDDAGRKGHQSGDVLTVWAGKQLDVGKSRKQVAPLLRAAVKAGGESSSS